MIKILFTGGGTGGHVYPLVAIAREIRRLYSKSDLEFHYLGPKDEFGNILLLQEDFKIQNIFSGKIRRYFSLQNFLDAGFNIPFGFFQSLYFMIINRPNMVFSKGGSGSISVAWAARILNIPLFIHESDSVPGLSNQMASKWAKKIFVSFPKTEYFDSSKIILAGNPVRSELLDGNMEEAKKLFDLTLEKPVILFYGGSQGAQALNDFVLQILNEILKDFEIIHATGMDNYKQVLSEAEVVIDKNFEKYYHATAYMDEDKIKSAYKAADLIVARAGASSIFEIAALGKPSILVPLPGAAQNHQAKNAYQYGQAGACIVLEQDNLTPNFFMEKVRSLFFRKEDLEKMSQEALRFSKPMAAKTVAREVLEFLTLS